MPSFPLVLCYHKIERRRELGVTRLSPRRFARQVERFARDGWRSLTLAELLDVAAGRRVVREREVAFTFDDAYRGLREHAFPVLAANGFTGICAVITEYAGRLNRWDVAYGGRRFAHLAWRDLRHWQSRGIDVVSHTARHPRMTWCMPNDASRELSESRQALRDALDLDARTIAWPFGAAAAREWTLARSAGYESGFALASGDASEPMHLPRLPVYMWAMPQPGAGALRSLEWRVADMANRCAVGTTMIQARSARGITRSSARSPAATTDAAPGRA